MKKISFFILSFTLLVTACVAREPHWYSFHYDAEGKAVGSIADNVMKEKIKPENQSLSLFDLTLKLYGQKDNVLRLNKLQKLTKWELLFSENGSEPIEVQKSAYLQTLSNHSDWNINLYLMQSEYEGAEFFPYVQLQVFDKTGVTKDRMVVAGEWSYECTIQRSFRFIAMNNFDVYEHWYCPSEEDGGSTEVTQKLLLQQYSINKDTGKIHKVGKVHVVKNKGYSGKTFIPYFPN